MSLFALGTAQTFANRLEISDGYGLVNAKKYGNSGVDASSADMANRCF